MKNQVKTDTKAKLKKVDDGLVLELKGQLARSLADYDNLRKRVERDRVNFEKLANLRLVVKLLPVLDVLKQAQNHVKDQGVAITIKEFEDALLAEGIEEVGVKVGDEFDPELHEVVEVVSGNGDNIIAEVVLTGWRFKDGPVVRHARVKVSQNLEEKEEKN